MTKKLAELDAQIAVHVAHLRALRRQRAAISRDRMAARKARHRAMLQLFDDEGMSAAQIARKLKMDDNIVRQFLWSRGRTKRGREAIRSQLLIMQQRELH